jgi:hypothetical protein
MFLILISRVYGLKGNVGCEGGGGGEKQNQKKKKKNKNQPKRKI